MQKNKSSVIVITILAILVVVLGGYIGFDKLLNKDKTSTNTSTSTTENNEVNQKNDDEHVESAENNELNIKNDDENVGSTENNTQNNQTSSKDETYVYKARCYGTYYVNGNQNEGAVVLNEDGTFKGVNSETYGVFVIHDNTITFIEAKHTVGPREEDPRYTEPKSYLISDDCSNIRLTDSGSHTSASLKRAN